MDCNKCPVEKIEEEIKKVCFSVTSGKLENHRGYLALVRRAYKADAAMKLLDKVTKMDAKYILDRGQCTKNDCKECALVEQIKEFLELDPIKAVNVSAEIKALYNDVLAARTLKCGCSNHCLQIQGCGCERQTAIHQAEECFWNYIKEL